MPAVTAETSSSSGHGAFEDGRPWQMLQGFAIKGAEELYQTAVEQALRRQHGNKGAALSALMRDDGKVLVAGFRVGAPMHLNCADAPLAALEHLHGILSEAFLHGAQLGMAAGWRCAADDAHVESYDPSRTGWPGEKTRKMSRRTADIVSTAHSGDRDHPYRSIATT